MVGQEKLLKEIHSFNIDTFPHTSLIVGEKGSGKHVLLQEIENLLKLPVVNMIDKDSKQEDIRAFVQETIYTTSEVKVYVFDLTVLGNKRIDTLQSTLLKLAEEPLNNVFIIILAEYKEFLLRTIVNRCRVFEIAPYSRKELEEFTKDELLLNILRTPGQILATNPEAVKKCSEVTDTIANKIRTVNLPNLLKVVDMINYKDEFDKIDFNLFFDVLANKLFNMYKNENNLDLLTYYLFVINERKKLRTDQQALVVDKERFVEHFLVKFWEVAHGM